jgi:tetratricopeptide (TPR) repeat protein
MLKWYADRLTQQALGEEAESIMRRMIGLLNPTQPEVLETIDWFRKRECWVLAAEVAERFPDLFRRSPQLLYRLAETHAQLGRHDQADQVAREAMAIVSEGAEKHMEMAANLQHDGLFTWAEREYRHVAGLLEEAPSEAARAKLYLSEMLHDTRQDAAAGEVLEEMIRAVESDEDFRRIVEIELGRELGAIKSRKYFFQAQHQGRSGDRSGERASLLEGYRHDPHDADLLIAMYRLADADEAWMEETRERIGAAAEHFRSQIKDLTNRMNSSRAFEDRALASFQLALVHNQFAWLIANTEGDFDESLRCSRRSLELQPNRAGFLDTLGRCYYAKGDYVNAVKYQTQAVALEPHSPQMLAQLSLFETALEAQRAAPTPAPSAGEISD